VAPGGEEAAAPPSLPPAVAKPRRLVVRRAGQQPADQQQRPGEQGEQLEDLEDSDTEVMPAQGRGRAQQQRQRPGSGLDDEGGGGGGAGPPAPAPGSAALEARERAKAILAARAAAQQVGGSGAGCLLRSLAAGLPVRRLRLGPPGWVLPAPWPQVLTCTRLPACLGRPQGQEGEGHVSSATLKRPGVKRPRSSAGDGEGGQQLGGGGQLPYSPTREQAPDSPIG
jgi:hypothetical protein